METALEFTVTAQLHKDNFVQREPDQVQRLRDRCACILGVGHLEMCERMRRESTRRSRTGGGPRELCLLPETD